jgi:hypothetical protein
MANRTQDRFSTGSILLSQRKRNALVGRGRGKNRLTEDNYPSSENQSAFHILADLRYKKQGGISARNR